MYETTVTMDVPKVGGNYTAKVFVWDDSMRPIGDVYETEYNVESPFALSNVFSDNMMLQADEDITVWGTGVPNDTVTVTLKERTQKQHMKQTAQLLRTALGGYT